MGRLKFELLCIGSTLDTLPSMYTLPDADGVKCTSTVPDGAAPLDDAESLEEATECTTTVDPKTSTTVCTTSDTMAPESVAWLETIWIVDATSVDADAPILRLLSSALDAKIVDGEGVVANAVLTNMVCCTSVGDENDDWS